MQTTEDAAALRRSYISVLERCREERLRSVALCAVSTGKLYANTDRIEQIITHTHTSSCVVLIELSHRRALLYRFDEMPGAWSLTKMGC